MGGRPRTEGAKPPSADSSDASPKRVKSKAGAAAGAVPAAPARGKAKAASPAAPPAPAAPAAPPKGAKSKASVAPKASPAAAVPKRAKPKGSGAAELLAAIAGVGAPGRAKAKKGSAAAAEEALPVALEPAAAVADADADAATDEDELPDDDEPSAEAIAAVGGVPVPRPPRLPPPFARTSGAPALGFPADKRPAPRWEFAATKPLSLPLGVRSTGGVGKGVIVELSGAAITEGLFAASELVHDGARASFVRDAATGTLRAKLADAAIPIGVQVPLSPPPRDEMQRYAAKSLLASTHIELSIEGQGARVGTALLSVAARPATGTSAPLKWTRPISFK